MKRIFIAIKVYPEESFLEMLNCFKSVLRNDNVKWINPENVHLTLAFLGNTEDKVISEIGTMLEKTCKSTGQFEMVIRGTGVFRNLNDPRIIWTNIDHSDELLKLDNKILSVLRMMNIKLDDKPFKPHITIGRLKHLNDKEAFKQLTEQYKSVELQKVSVSEVILYESILLEKGPKYVPVGKYDLK
jgi:RNA 2',3'-cyclic 3'-phosphodiesterase